MGLLTCPDEVLEITLKYLLPPFRSQSLAETHVFTVPTDLLSARLVSRRLNQLATPLAWRRVQLRIASPESIKYMYGSPDSTTILIEKRELFRSLVRGRFFQEHPGLAAHVRVLLVSFNWRAGNPDLAREVLRAATGAMSNLRTVLVWYPDVLTAEDIRQLVRKPLLRTVCVMDIDGSAFPERDDWGCGLKMLHIANSTCPAKLIINAGASLECVSIEAVLGAADAGPPEPTLRELPWKTLKEVALVDCLNEQDWLGFLDGFQLHRRLGFQPALSELLVGNLTGLEPYHITQLLHTFGGHPLTRLTLYHVLALDPLTVVHIAQAFPKLRHLSLLTDGGLAPWPGAIESYVRAFAGFPLLQSLAWNNLTLDPALDAAFYSLSDDTLGVLYAASVHALALRVRTLRYIKFVSMTDYIIDTVFVRRGGSEGGVGKGVAPVELRRTMYAALNTSSWCTTSEALEDI